MFFFFFFSSRRRHTRSLCDWSSDVCSSDLDSPPTAKVSDGHSESLRQKSLRRACPPPNAAASLQPPRIDGVVGPQRDDAAEGQRRACRGRSEERRVGKEGSSGWWQEHIDEQ